MFKVNIKDDVKLKEINEVYLCIIEALSLLPFAGYTPTITSANDGKHMAGSLHYANRAMDIRCNDLPKDKWPVYLSTLKERLGKDYDVVLEGNSGDNSHVHVEYDPKGGS